MRYYTSKDYSEAVQALMAGWGQLSPDGRNCAICEDSGHQAWECHHNPLNKMARAEKADKEWRCFICGEVFTDEGAASLHFGEDSSKPPACRSDKLLVLLRWSEQQRSQAVQYQPEGNIYRMLYKTLWVNTWDTIVNKIKELL